MLGYTYTFTNPYNGKTFKLNGNADGTMPCATGTGMLLQVYPQFELEVRNESRFKEGQHGIIDFFSFYGQRNITFEGIIIGSYAESLQYQNQIREVLTLPAQPLTGGADGYVTCSWTDQAGDSWYINVKVTQDIRFSRELRDRTKLNFFMNLKSADPFIRSLTEYDQSELHGWSQGRLTIPAFLPNTVNIDWNQMINVYQSGTADGPGTYRMTGPLTNPKITKLIESFSNSQVVTDFDDVGWSGGTEETTTTLSGGTARSLTSSGSQDSMILTGTWDLSSPEFNTFYLNVDDATAFEYGDYDVSYNYVKFITTDGVDEFVLEFKNGNGTIRNGWNYFQALRDEFKVIGSPSWASIVKIEFSIKARTGESLTVIFDECANRDIQHTEKKLELTDLTISTNEYVDFDVVAGTIKKGDGTDVSGYLSTDSEWFYVSPQQNLFLLESDNNPLITYEYPFTINDPITEDDLVAYYPMDETSGTDVVDYVGSNDGVATSTNISVGGGAGGSNARVFNGTSGNVEIPDTLAIRNIFDDGATLSFVINPTTDGEGSSGRILEKTNGWRVLISADDGTNSKITFVKDFSGTDGSWISTSLVLTLGELNNIVIRYNASSVANDPTIEVNGITATLTESATPVGTSDDDTGGALYVGNRSADDRTFDGIIDEVRLYDVALSDDNAYPLGFFPEQNKYKEQLSIYWNNSIL